MYEQCVNVQRDHTIKVRKTITGKRRFYSSSWLFNIVKSDKMTRLKLALTILSNKIIIILV